MLSYFKYVICWLSVFHVANTQARGNNGLQISNGPGMTDEDTLRAVGRALHAAKLQGRDTTYTMNKTSIAKSWVDATLFEYDVSGTIESADSTLELDAGIAIVCSTCYVNGSVTGEFKITGDLNITEIVDSVESEVTSITTRAYDEFKSYVDEVAKDIGKEIADLDFDDIHAWPSLDFDLNLNDTTGIPGIEVSFEFDGLEFYVDLAVQLSAGATYTLNLYTSESIVGVSLPNTLEAGVVFTVDLILIADAEIDITGGIHVKLDDGFVLDLELFNQDVSNIKVPSGSYEFLPVTIDGEGSIQAILRLESSLGFQIEHDSFATSFLNFSAGVSGSVFAYVADLLLQVNGSSAVGSDDCDLAAIAEYSIAVGAAAGATAAINTYQWGPTPNTTIPLFYTTLASVCAATMPSTTTPLVTSTPELQGRDAFTTTTVSSTVDYTIVNCVESGLVDCPVNLQTTASVKKTLTSVMTVASGFDATFPVSTYASVTSAIPFGTNARRLVSSSGTPTSYVPPTSTGGGGILDILSEKTDGKNYKLIIGLSVGLGVPFLACAIFGLYYWFRRNKKYAAVPQSSSALASGSPLQDLQVATGPGDDVKDASVTVASS